MSRGQSKGAQLERFPRAPINELFHWCIFRFSNDYGSFFAWRSTGCVLFLLSSFFSWTVFSCLWFLGLGSVSSIVNFMSILFQNAVTSHNLSLSMPLSAKTENHKSLQLAFETIRFWEKRRQQKDIYIYIYSRLILNLSKFRPYLMERSKVLR